MLNDEQGSVTLPIEWDISDAHSEYATNFVVQHTQNEFFLYFFEIVPPLVIGTEEEAIAQLQQIDKVTATCKARIILHPDKIPEIISVLSKNYEKYQAKQSSSTECD